MTSEDKVSIEENKIRSAATDGKWSIVLELYKKREIRTVKITPAGDTVLHMAVSSGKEHEVEVESMVKLVCGGERSNEEDKNSELLSVENGDEKQLVLGAQNAKGDTPLHLAAVTGNVEMCKKISKAEASLASKRNCAGETPLFMAALHNNRKAFLWLYYQYKECPGVSATDLAHCIKRDNNDTILHCVLEQEHIGVAIEIVHLYNDNLKQMIMRNKDGVSPLHILAATPSVFESTDLPGRPFFVRFLRCLPFLRVKNKRQATTKEELERCERKPCFRAIVDTLEDYVKGRLELEVSSRAKLTKDIIAILLGILAVITLIPLLIAGT